MKQLCVTTAMGKRLIGKALAHHPAIQGAIREGTLVIIAGTTNGYVAEEVLGSMDQAAGFTRTGFRRGMTVAPGAQVPNAEFPGDVVIRDGQWQQGKTIYVVADELAVGDVILKGGNAFDARGQAAVHVGHPKGGTILAAEVAVVGQRAKLIVPIGLEKRVFEDVYLLAQRCNAAEAQGPRLYPISGEIFTELDAIKLLTGAEAVLLASGGIYGAEGATWLGIDGDEGQVQAAVELIHSVAGEPPCRV